MASKPSLPSLRSDPALALRAHRVARTVRLRRFALAALSLLAGVAFGSSQASAQEIDLPAVVDSDIKAPRTSATLQYAHQFEADVEDAGTELARHNVLVGFGHRFALGEKTELTALATYTLHGYDLSDSSDATPSVYAWDEVHRGVLGGLVSHDLDARWRLIAGAMVRSWGESGAQFGDTLTGGLIGGFDYHPSDDFSVGLLLGAFSKLGGGIGLLPLPTLKWRFAPDWRINVGMIQLADPGLGAQLDYQITPELAVATGFAFQSRQFRLADRTRAVGRPNHPNRTDDGGIGSERELPVFLSLRFRPMPRAEIDLFGGVAFRGNLRVEDEDGGRIADDDYDAAGILGLKGQIVF